MNDANSLSYVQLDLICVCDELILIEVFQIQYPRKVSHILNVYT